MKTMKYVFHYFPQKNCQKSEIEALSQPVPTATSTVLSVLLLEHI